MELQDDGEYISVQSNWYADEEKKHKLNEVPWYHGAIDRHIAEKRVVGTEKGSFLVRASVKDKRAYAFTISNGGKAFIHEQIVLADDGFYKVEHMQFLRLHDAVEYYSEHAFKVGIKLGAPLPNPDNPIFALMAPSGKLKSESAVSGYEEPAKAALDLSMSPVPSPNSSPRLKRKDTIDTPPLPLDVKTWDEGEVQRWLKENGLGIFKSVLYANSVNGKQLLELRGVDFPAGKYAEADIEAFDQALVRLRLTQM